MHHSIFAAVGIFVRIWVAAHLRSVLSEQIVESTAISYWYNLYNYSYQGCNHVIIIVGDSTRAQSRIEPSSITSEALRGAAAAGRFLSGSLFGSSFF